MLATRFRHLIRPNASTRMPSAHACVQVVASEENPSGKGGTRKFRFSGVATCFFRLEANRVTRIQETWHEELADFWDCLRLHLSEERPTWMWSDDLAWHATLLNLWEELDKGRFAHKSIVMARACAYVSLSAGKKKCIWIDRRNWWRRQLPPVEFGRLSAAITRRQWEGKDSFGELNARGRVRQLKVMVYKLDSFLRKNDLGVAKITASAQALAAYRHRLGPRIEEVHTPSRGRNAHKPQKRTILLPRVHNNETALELEEAALHGGRIACFYLGKVKEKIFVLDVCGLYPGVMSHYPMPSELLAVGEGESNFLREKVQQNEPVIATVSIDTEKLVAPVRRKFGTVYARGRFTTTVAGPELRPLWIAESIRRFHCWAVYRPADLFSKYVDTLLSLRVANQQNGNNQWADLAKLVLNSLAGKFAQRAVQWQASPKVLCQKRWGFWHDLSDKSDEAFFRRGIAGKCETEDRGGWADHAFPAVTAAIYSHARAYMDQIFKVGSVGKIYYSAVDSVHCDERAAQAILDIYGCDRWTLGRVRLVEEGKDGHYYGPGDYRVGDKVVRAGLPLEVGGSAADVAEWQRRPTFNEIVQAGPKGEITTLPAVFRRQNKFPFGRVQKDGWVKPLILKE